MAKRDRFAPAKEAKAVESAFKGKLYLHQSFTPMGQVYLTYAAQKLQKPYASKDGGTVDHAVQELASALGFDTDKAGAEAAIRAAVVDIEGRKARGSEKESAKKQIYAGFADILDGAKPAAPKRKARKSKKANESDADAPVA